MNGINIYEAKLGEWNQLQHTTPAGQQEVLGRDSLVLLE